MLKRCLFWFPALYLGTIFLAILDSVFAISGSGEANLGVWIIFFSVIPAAIVGKAMGVSEYLMESKALVVMAVLLQALMLLALGAVVDAIRRRRRPDRIVPPNIR